MQAVPTQTRSGVFAFKCRMGTPLTRLDFNLALRANSVKQLFYSIEDGVHQVCIRLTTATTRVRLVNMLMEIQGKPLTNLRLPLDADRWGAVIFMGNQLRNGEGAEMIQTLKRHMENRLPSYFESLCTTSRHLTHMLRDELRPNPEDQAPQIAMAQPLRNELRPNPEDQARQIARAPSLAPTLPELEAEINSMVFSPAMILDGEPNRVESDSELGRMISTTIRDILNIDEQFDLPRAFLNATNRIDVLVSEITRLRSSIASHIPI